MVSTIAKAMAMELEKKLLRRFGEEMLDFLVPNASFVHARGTLIVCFIVKTDVWKNENLECDK